MASASGNIKCDRSRGTSRRCGNPLAEFSKADGSASTPSAFLFLNDELMEGLRRCGFADAMTGEADFLFSHASYEHMQPYLAIIKHKPARDAPRVQDAHRLMLFDREVKSVLFKYIGVFETKMRAQYAGIMSHEHGSFCVYDSSNFLRPKHHEASLRRYRSEAERKRLKGSPQIARAMDSADGRCPIELGVECITLGTLSELYANTKDNTATAAVAASFGTPKSILSNWLKVVCAARNAMAHFEPFVGRAQLAAIPRGIKGLSANQRAPFYVSFLLLSLLSTDHPFADDSLSYAATLACELDAVLAKWEPSFGYLYHELGVPGDWRSAMCEAAQSGNLFEQ